MRYDINNQRNICKVLAITEIQRLHKCCLVHIGGYYGVFRCGKADKLAVQIKGPHIANIIFAMEVRIEVSIITNS